MTKTQLLAAIRAIDPAKADEYAKSKKPVLESVLLTLQTEPDLSGEYEPDLDENGNEIPLDEDDNEKPTMAGQLKRYREGYVPTTAYSGRKSLNNGDDLATEMAGLTPVQVCSAAERICGLETGELVAKYENLNPGQQRMNAGNRIRAAVKREDVTVDEAIAQLH